MDNEESTSSPANDASTPTYVNRLMRLVYFHVLRTMFNYCGIVPHYVEVKFFEADTMAVSVHGKLYGSIHGKKTLVFWQFYKTLNERKMPRSQLVFLFLKTRGKLGVHYWLT